MIRVVHPIVSREDCQHFPFLRSLTRSELSEAERLAITACLDLVAALSSASYCTRYIYVFYEDLVEDPCGFDRVLEYICPASTHHFAQDETSAPSSTTGYGSNVLLEHADPRLSWRSRLSTDQTEQILTIMERFGIGFYSTAPSVATDTLGKYNSENILIR